MTYLETPLRLTARRFLTSSASTAAIAGLACIAGAAAAQAQSLEDDFNGAIQSVSNGNRTINTLADYTVEMCIGLDGKSDKTAIETELNLRCAGAVFEAVGSGYPIPGNSDPLGALDALRHIAPDELPAMGSDVNEVVGSHSDAIVARLSALGRVFSGGGGFAGLGEKYRREPVVLASNEARPAVGGGELGGGLGGFFNVGFGWGEQDDTDEEVGFDQDAYSVTGGVDYRFSPTTVGGVALGYSSSDVEFSDGNGTLDTEAYVLAAYGLIYPTENFSLSGLLSYATANYDSVRVAGYLESDLSGGTQVVNEAMSGDTDGNIFQASVTAAYDFIGGATTFGPIGGVSYVSTQVDGFAETGSELALRYEDQDIESLQASLGVQVFRSTSQSYGVLSPYGRASVIYEAMDDSRQVQVVYDNDPFFGMAGSTVSPGFLLTTSSPDRTRYEVGAGVSATFAGGWSGFADYSTILDYDDVSSHAVFLGLRNEF